VTDYVPNDGKTDVADALQAVIDENPNRTIYFPDGIYLISKDIFPVRTFHFLRNYRWIDGHSKEFLYEVSLAV